MARLLDDADIIGFLDPAADSRSLGSLVAIEQMLEACGLETIWAGREICEAADKASSMAAARSLGNWIKGRGVTAVVYGCRREPELALRLLSDFLVALKSTRSLATEGGRVRTLFFAGLSETCDIVRERFPAVSGVFRGDEGPAEIIEILGLPRSLLPDRAARDIAYDEARIAFGRELVEKGEYLSVGPVDRKGSRRFGQRGDGIAARIAHGAARGLPPIVCATVGAFLPDRKEALDLLRVRAASLARSGLLDVLNIRTSRLSRSEFGRNWEGMVDGGGVPIRTPEEFAEIWRAARPMLLRSPAGARDVESAARILEESLDAAWQAFSLWWTCLIDRRGPNSVAENISQHLAAIKSVAADEKPVEPDAPHRFAARGGDDLTYVLSGLVAAKAAKAAGVQKLILPISIGAAGRTWSLEDLAKARALLHLVRELEDADFKVYLRAKSDPTDSFRSPGEAKARLAAATALMDDIEPGDASSPQIIHVASYSEGSTPSNPDAIDESIRIARHALEAYRANREAGGVEDMSSNPQVLLRTSELLRDTRNAIGAIESSIAFPYGATGLYEILASGFFAAPDLPECREEFAAAVRWRTRPIGGAIVAVDERGATIPAADRIAVAVEAARSRAARDPGLETG
jgi:hypothetical protein